MRRQRILVFLIGALLESAPASAQLGNVQEGARVRLRAASGATTAGILLNSPKDSVFINGSTDSSYPSVQKFALRNVAAADLSIGQRGHAGQGMLIGAVAGAGVGYLIAHLTKEDADGNPIDEVVVGSLNRAVDGLTVIGGGLVGALVGGIIGHAKKSDTWQAVDMSGTLPQLTVRNIRGGRTRIGLLFAFGGASYR